jgi:hypothetical protein
LANADNLKSTTGYVFLAAGGAIIWRSKKQTIVASLSTESKYITLSEAGREACWLWNLYGELGFPQMGPTIIMGNNEGSVALTWNPQTHNQSKHIDIRHHWIQDLVNNNVLEIENCCDPDQTADILMKALSKPKHNRHQEEMGV